MHQKPCEPPDRPALPAAPPPCKILHNAMSSSAQSAGTEPIETTVYPVVGGGDYGAPSVDAARPKPSDGGSVAAVAMYPRVQPLAVWEQVKKMGAAELPPHAREEIPEVHGLADFMEGEDEEVEVEIAEQMCTMTGGAEVDVKELDATDIPSRTGNMNAQTTANSQPRSSDVIPAMQNLYHDARMAGAELSDHQSTLGTPKKRKTDGTQKGQQTAGGGEMLDQGTEEQTNTMEAAGLGAAGDLTELAELRQEQ